MRVIGKDPEVSWPSAPVSGLLLRLEPFVLCIWGKMKCRLAKMSFYIWAFLDGSSPTPTFCELFGVLFCFGIGSRDFIH